MRASFVTVCLRSEIRETADTTKQKEETNIMDQTADSRQQKTDSQGRTWQLEIDNLAACAGNGANRDESVYISCKLFDNDNLSSSRRTPSTCVFLHYSSDIVIVVMRW
jgi:hypothetical protein